MLAEIISQIAGAEQTRQKYHPRPSSSGPERCIRSMVYDAMGIEPKKIPGRAILVMDDSSHHEDLTIGWINKSVMTIHSNQRGVNCMAIDSPFLNHEYVCKTCGDTVPAGMIHGHIDGICEEMTGEKHLFEHKALNHFSFQRLENGERLPQDYVCQTVMYENGLRENHGEKLGFSILLVKNKNTAQYMEFHILYNKDEDTVTIQTYMVDYNDDGKPFLLMLKEDTMFYVLKNVKSKFEAIDKHFKGKTLPERPYIEPEEFPCGYCGWKNHCWADYKNEILNRKNAVQLDPAIIDLVVAYKATGVERIIVEKKEKDLKQQIKQAMIDKAANTGIAGPWLVNLTQDTTSRIDKKLIPFDILQLATKETACEKIKIEKLNK
jgi:hypothetical protein